MTEPHVADRRTLPPVVRRFLETEAAGGVVLVAAAVVALAWANSPWRDAYASLWHTGVDLRIGTFGFTGDLHHLINDGAMTLFFLGVGLEIKRELVTGDLRDRRVAALPAFAAIGGMVVPAGLYFAVNAGGPGAGGWGIPMATDIAFALGVVALLGARVPSSLKLFLLSLAIVDDIGAILVIAVFYAGDLDVRALLVAFVAIGGAVVLRSLRVHWLPAYVAVGVVCWVAMYESGVHATIAGVVFGLLAPARPLGPADVVGRWSLDMSDEPSAEELHALTAIARESVSSAERVAHALHPLTSFVIVPLFALGNAGVELRIDGLDARVMAGVGLGLVVGKIVGVFGATWLAVRLGVAALPHGATWPAVAGIAALAGIGFTVSLFVAELAFSEPALRDAAKVAILAASVCAAGLGATMLARRQSADPSRAASSR